VIKGDESNSGDAILNYFEHFSEVFEETDVEAALAAGIFHREEVPIEAVKDHMREKGIETR
jgi:glutamine amidotransferase/cyclase